MPKQSPTAVQWNTALLTQVDENLRLLIGNSSRSNELTDCLEYHVVGPNVYSRSRGRVTIYQSEVYKVVDENGETVPNISRLPFVSFEVSSSEDLAIRQAIVEHAPSVIFRLVQSKLQGKPGFVVKDDTIRSPDGYCDIPAG